jgi:hypothetical protein
MWSALRLPWSGNSLTRILPFLLAALVACSGSHLDRVARCVVTDSQVWVDTMPGTKPRTHAILMIRLRNTGTERLIFRPVQGTLVDASSGDPLRRFELVMEYRDVRTEEAMVLPGTDVELRLRTPMGVPPIDVKRHPAVIFVARLASSVDEPLTIESKPLDVFVTQ